MKGKDDFINKIIQGDTLEVLKTFPDNLVDTIITSPPYYGLRDYGVEGQVGLEETFNEFLEKILLITGELKRVLKKTGTFWLNMGDCYGGVKIGKTDEKCSDYVKEAQSGLKKCLPGFEKCMLMQPERLALAMIDGQNWILRNKIKWAKQVFIKKQGKTIGSVMPTSVKDRFNESGEEFYFFVKSKKYYFDLDAVRLPNQVLGVTDFREDPLHSGSGFVRTPELYKNSKYNNKKFRPKYTKGSEYEQKYGEPWDRFGENTIKNKMSSIPGQSVQGIERGRAKKKTLEARMFDTKNKDTKSSRSYNMKKLLSEVRLGIKPNTGMDLNKAKDPISDRMLDVYGDDRKGARRSRVRQFQDEHKMLETNIKGKNIQIGRAHV